MHTASSFLYNGGTQFVIVDMPLPIPVLANLQFASGEEGIFNSHIIVEAPRCGVSAFFVLGCAAAMVLRQGLHYISPGRGCITFHPCLISVVTP